MSTPVYKVLPVSQSPELKGLWNGSAWGSILPLEVASFRPEGGSHRPRTQCKLQYELEGVYGIFQVEDQYIRCVHSEFQSDVYKDSCVEVFLEPKPGEGYFNFEFNCLGVLKAAFITDPTRIDGQIQGENLTKQDDTLIRRYHSIKVVDDLDPNAAITWYLEFFIPFRIMEKHMGSSIELGEWRGNVYKCGDETLYPHWASWSPISELNFHLPHNFGIILL